MYMRVMLHKLRLDKDLRLISYQVSLNYYLFLMIYGDQEFFLRLSIDDVLACDAQYEDFKPLLTEESSIIHVIRKNALEKHMAVDYMADKKPFSDLKNYN